MNVEARHSLGQRGLAIGGYAFAAAVFVVMAQAYGWPGRDAHIWHDVGVGLVAGVSPYQVHGPGGFFYAPPWAVAFALVSWVPVEALAVAILIAEILALRYVAGSWLRAGYVCWLPIVPLELVGSQWNLVMAAGIAAAVRGRPELASVMAFAKLSPVLAINPRQWRRALQVAALVALVAVVRPLLWPEWIGQLVATMGTNVAPGAEITIPLLPRLVAAGVLLVVVRRPWARVLAAVLATPALYWASGVLLFALLHLAADDERAVRPLLGVDVPDLQYDGLAGGN